MVLQDDIITLVRYPSDAQEDDLPSTPPIPDGHLRVIAKQKSTGRCAETIITEELYRKNRGFLHKHVRETLQKYNQESDEDGARG